MSELQTPFNVTPNEKTADNTAKPMPLDRSSEEWRSQFGVLPSRYRRGGTMRPVPGHVRDAAAGADGTLPKSNRFSLLAALVGMILVGGLIVYGYFPSQQTVNQNNAEGTPGKAAAARKPGQKPLRSAQTARASATASDAVATAVSLSKPPSKTAVKRAVKSARKPRNLALRSPRKPEKKTRPIPVQTAAARSPRAVLAIPERAPATAPKTKARTAPAAQPLPKVAPPTPKGAESEGTNPLGLPL